MARPAPASHRRARRGGPAARRGTAASSRRRDGSPRRAARRDAASDEVGRPLAKLSQSTRTIAAMQVVLVEDDEAIARPLARALRREGYAVRVAATGAEALAEVDA